MRRKNSWQIAEQIGEDAPHGAAFFDREHHLPKEWTDDPARCSLTGVAEGTAFANKFRLVRAMLERAFAANVTSAWVTGDEVYGIDWGLRRWLEEEWLPYVLALRGNPYVWSGARQVTASAKALPKRSWHAIAIAEGSKEPRRYAWAWAEINHDLGPRRRRWLLVCKGLDWRE